MRDVIEVLVESRRTDYVHDPRIVIRPEAFDVGDERKIHVASAIPGPKPETPLR